MNVIIQHVTFHVCLFSLNVMVLRFSHVAASVAEYYSIVCMWYVFFTHWPTDGCLGCFCLLAFVKRATRTFVYKYLFEFLFSILWSIYLGVELVGSKVILILCLTFWGTTQLFSIAAEFLHSWQYYIFMLGPRTDTGTFSWNSE